MFIRGCSLGCTVFIICVPYLTSCWASCIVLSFVLPLLDYCDTVWSPSSVQYFKKFKRIHSKFCSLIPATQSFLCHTLAECGRFHTAIIVSRTLHQLSPAYLREHLSTLQPLPPMLEGTVIAFLYQESGLHMERIVFTIKGRRFGTH